VAEVNVGGGGVDAEIDAEWSAGLKGVFEFRFQFGFGNDFGRAFFQVGELFFDGFEFGFGHFLVGLNDAAAFDFETAFEDDSNGFGINSVFLMQNARGEGVLRVVVFYWQDSLENDGASVEIFVDEMDGAASEFDAVFEGLALRFEAGERREKGRMNVEDAVGERGDEVRGEKAHVAGEADEVDFVFVEDGDDLTVVGFALEAFGGDGAGGDAAGFGAVEAGSAFAIAEDYGDFGVGDAGGGNAVRKGFEVRAAAA
jgi:hypothetical protein